MSKSNNFSIFLLKQGYSYSNSLQSDHELKKVDLNDTDLPEGSVMYIADNPQSPPWWKSYWGVKEDIYQSLKGALIFVEVNGRCFAITHGHTRHLLLDNSYEYDFGIRTTLNALDPKEIKSTEILIPESSKRQLTQSPQNTVITFFDFNRDESIVKRLSGKVMPVYKEILGKASGSTSLTISTKKISSEFQSLLSELLVLYNSEDYKTSFPDLQNIAAVKDPEVIKILELLLLRAFSDGTVDLVLSIPAFIDDEKYAGVKFTVNGKSSKVFVDPYIAQYRSLIEEVGAEIKSVIDFKNHSLKLVDENKKSYESFSMYNSLIFETTHMGVSYHLSEGRWYAVEKNFEKKIKKEINEYFHSEPALLPCEKRREDEYNSFVADSHEDIICLDKTDISPKGERHVEPCDLIRFSSDGIDLMHIKVSTRSSGLSHLFNQGINSAKLIRLDQQSRDKLKTLVGDDDAYHKLIDKGDLKVVYGIISGKDAKMKAEALPLFSKISLYRALRELKLMGVQCTVVLIKDEVSDRKEKAKDFGSKKSGRRKSSKKRAA